MELNVKDQIIIDKNNEKIDIINKKIDKIRQNFIVKHRKFFRNMMAIGIVVSFCSLVGALYAHAFVLPIANFLAGLAIVGAVSFAIPSFLLAPKALLLEDWQNQKKALQIENNEIKYQCAKTLINQAILANDFSKIDNDVIENASKEELSKALEMLLSQKQIDNPAPTLSKEEIGTNEDIISQHHAPKILKKGTIK